MLSTPVWCQCVDGHMEAGRVQSSGLLSAVTSSRKLPDTPDWYWRPRPVHPGALGLPVFIVISQVQTVSSSIFRSRHAVLNHRLYVLFVFNLPALPRAW